MIVVRRLVARITAAAPRALAALALASSVAAAGCGDSTGPKISTNGRWSGVIEGATVTLTLTQSARSVSGNGSLATADESIALTVDGTFTSPDVVMTFTSPDFEPVNYTATVTARQMQGTLIGSGFTGESLTLNKQ